MYKYLKNDFKPLTEKTVTEKGAIRENLEFIPCSHVAEVLENVLVSKKQDKSTGSARPRKTARVSSGDRVRISTTEA